MVAGECADFGSHFRQSTLDIGKRKVPVMSQDPLFLIAVAAAFVVVIILMLGIGGFAKGGEFNRKHANRLMRYRVAGQAVAVLLLLLFAYVRSSS